MLVLVVGALPALRARATARSRLQGFVAQPAPTAQRSAVSTPRRAHWRGIPRPEWLTGREVPVAAGGEDRPGDVRIYLTDASRLYALSDWRPQRSAEEALADTAAWLREHEQLVVSTLF